jgi:hypothetical protein
MKYQFHIIAYAKLMIYTQIFIWIKCEWIKKPVFDKDIDNIIRQFPKLLNTYDGT